MRKHRYATSHCWSHYYRSVNPIQRAFGCWTTERMHSAYIDWAFSRNWSQKTSRSNQDFPRLPAPVLSVPSWAEP
jgi:hypothetical protein